MGGLPCPTDLITRKERTSAGCFVALELVAKYGGVGAALLGQPDLVPPSMRSNYTSGMAIVFFLVLGPCLRWVFEWQQQLHYVDYGWTTFCFCWRRTRGYGLFFL